MSRYVWARSFPRSRSLPPGPECWRIALLAQAAAAVLIGWYVYATLVPEYAEQLGISEHEVRWLAAMPIIGLFVVEPLARRWSRRWFAAGSMAGMAGANLATPHVTGLAPLVLQIVAATAAFGPWSIVSCMQERNVTWGNDETRRGEGVRAVYWGLAYAGMAGAIMLTDPALSYGGLPLVETIFGLDLAAASVVTALLVPDEDPDRVKPRWRDAFALDQLRSGVWHLAVHAALGGYLISSVDGYVRAAMDDASLGRSAAIFSSVAIVAGVLPVFFASRMKPQQRWLRVAGAISALGAAVLWLAWVLKSTGVFVLGRAGIEVGTSATTIITQLDGRTAALMQLAKSVGSLLAYLGNGIVWEHLGWPGICAAVMLAALVQIVLPLGAPRPLATSGLRPVGAVGRHRARQGRASPCRRRRVASSPRHRRVRYGRQEDSK